MIIHCTGKTYSSGTKDCHSAWLTMHRHIRPFNNSLSGEERCQTGFVISKWTIVSFRIENLSRKLCSILYTFCKTQSESNASFRSKILQRDVEFYDFCCKTHGWCERVFLEIASCTPGENNLWCNVVRNTVHRRLKKQVPKTFISEREERPCESRSSSRSEIFIIWRSIRFARGDFVDGLRIVGIRIVRWQRD